MFEDSLLECAGKNSMLHRSGRWATVASFAFELALIGVLVLIPFIYTETLPRLQLTSYAISLTPPSAPTPHVEAHAIEPVAHQSEIIPGGLKFPVAIPKFIAIIRDLALPNVTDTNLHVEGGTGLGDSTNGKRLVETIATTNRPVTTTVAATTRPITVSDGVIAGLLIRRVQPTYPAIARQARVSGEVQLRAVIGKDGMIEKLQVMGGHPMLVKSAIEAVRQWRYKPYYLNGQPVEVDTQITVNFTLAGA